MGTGHASSFQIANLLLDEQDIRCTTTVITVLNNSKRLENLACLLLPMSAQGAAFFKQRRAATAFAMRSEVVANRPTERIGMFVQVVVHATARLVYVTFLAVQWDAAHNLRFALNQWQVLAALCLESHKEMHPEEQMC